ncbi:pectinesterase [Coffea arabica]|uniref:Pectinesterase n=1 Tax=Coffea arabica TaxID=13443 RepID=A0A6P6X0U8_COFAR|nr:pectinesterase-like [Coffea arabica]
MGYDDSSRKKKLAILSVSSILLVAAVVGAVTYGSSHKNVESPPAGEDAAPVTSSSKAIQSLCQHTDYKETCEDSLSKAKNTSDPRELVKVAFQTTVDNLGEVIKNSSLLQNAAKDPRTSEALDICKEVLNTAIDDFKRSFDKVQNFDISKLDDYVADLKTWLSGAITLQQTCLDAFENTTGDTGEKMKQLMRTAVQLSSNGLAIVTDFSEILGTLAIPGLSRRLLSAEKRKLDEENFVERRLLQVDPASIKPNAIIAQDGSGTFKTIRDAINTVPKNNTTPFVILIKAGVYKEVILIPRRINNVVIMGEGPNVTKITANKNYVDGIGTFHTATVAINGDGCILRDIGIENSAGPEKHQAVALRVSGDRTIVYNCQIDGYQDTLYSHTYRQFYRDTTISGTIDFIFGDAAAVFQNCKLIVRMPLVNQACMVTAQGRNNSRSTGAIVLQNCSIVADPALLSADPPVRAYLGRPWKEYSRTIIMQSNIDGFIDPQGWSPWMGTFGLKTLYYAEYQNRGPGANTDQRVDWLGIQHITPQIAESFTPGKYFIGDSWITASGFPYVPGTMKV